VKLSAIELGDHIQGARALQSKLSDEIAGLEAELARLTGEHERAKARLGDISKGQVNIDIAETDEKIETEKAIQKDLQAQIQEIDEALGSYKEELARTFEQMKAKSHEMNRHCKARTNDEDRHTRDLDDGVTVLEKHTALARAAVLKKQQKLKTQAELEQCNQRLKALRHRLAELEEQKSREEADKKEIEGNFARKVQELGDLQKKLEAKRRKKAEVDALMFETDAAFAKIMNSSTTLLNCVHRERDCLAKKDFM